MQRARRRTGAGKARVDARFVALRGSELAMRHAQDRGGRRKLVCLKEDMRVIRVVVEGLIEQTIGDSEKQCAIRHWQREKRWTERLVQCRRTAGETARCMA